MTTETLFALITPQRATLYSQWVRQLAPLEWLASPLGETITQWDYTELGGLDGLILHLDREITERDIAFMGFFALTKGVFRLHGESSSPWLEPLPLRQKHVLPRTLLETRRYKGKTNELLTELMLNLAWFASPWAEDPNVRLRVLDPLAGGGTTLFAALIRGWDAFGVDNDVQTVDTTVAYLKHFLRTLRVKHQVEQARLRERGRRWTFTIKVTDPPLTCVLARGDTGDTFDLLASPKAHLLVTDFPYGVQHRGLVIDLLTRGMPSWLRSLRRGATIVLAWDQRTLKREELVHLLNGFSGLDILNVPPWNQFVHPVDRVIKKRDILVIRKASQST